MADRHDFSPLGPGSGSRQDAALLHIVLGPSNVSGQAPIAIVWTPSTQRGPQGSKEKGKAKATGKPKAFQSHCGAQQGHGKTPASLAVTVLQPPAGSSGNTAIPLKQPECQPEACRQQDQSLGKVRKVFLHGVSAQAARRAQPQMRRRDGTQPGPTPNPSIPPSPSTQGQGLLSPQRD